MQPDALSVIIREFFLTGRPVTYSKREIIVGLEPIQRWLYYIDSGYVKEYTISDRGDEQVHLLYKHGELFPLIWGYLGTNTSVYFEALDNVVVWRLPREQFLLFAQDSVRAGYAIAQQLAHQYSLYANRLDNLQLKSSKDRLAHRLLVLASRFGIQENQHILINIPLSHELIAASINLARESVSREFEKLEHQGIVSRHYHHIIINDINRLNAQLATPVSLEQIGF